MCMRSLLIRIAEKCRRTVSYRFCRRIVTIRAAIPFISFSFDDAPRTAFSHGGEILKANGARATFFVSLGLLGCESPSGTIAFQNDLLHAVEEGHELGCHTFDHKDPWRTRAQVFEQSVLKNSVELAKILPKTGFTTFAYPSRGPRPATKRRIGKLFSCCRGGGQAFNVGKVDLNLLKSFFLDKRTKVDIDMVKEIIDQNTLKRGWLIFSTHDVTDNPSPYGCTRRFFGEVVEYAARSGALILPVREACEKLLISNFRSANSE